MWLRRVLPSQVAWWIYPKCKCCGRTHHALSPHILAALPRQPPTPTPNPTLTLTLSTGSRYRSALPIAPHWSARDDGKVRLVSPLFNLYHNPYSNPTLSGRPSTSVRDYWMTQSSTWSPTRVATLSCVACRYNRPHTEPNLDPDPDIEGETAQDV